MHGLEYPEDVMSYLATEYTDNPSLRAELQYKPIMPGYLGPMWDGELHFGKDGKWHRSYDKFEPDTSVDPVGVLRYESQEVYNTLSM